MPNYPILERVTAAVRAFTAMMHRHGLVPLDYGYTAAVH
jgi:hypothetical protein